MRAQRQAVDISEGTRTLLPVVKTLMEGIARHSVKGDVEEFRKFRSRMHQISQSMDDAQLPDEALDTAGRAVDLMTDYGHRTSKRLHQQGVELHAVIKMLLETFRDLAIAGPERMRQLQDLGGELTASSDGEKLALSRLRLSECLGEIRRDAERFRLDADGQTSAPGNSKKDRLTGLESREAAEGALVAASAQEVPASAIVVVIDRIAVYNVRFGRAVGDKVLQFFTDYLLRSLPFEERPFRWSGPALLMVRPGTVEHVVSKVRRVLEQRVEYEVETDARTILLPIVARWDVLPMMTDARLVVNKIDSFVAFQGVPGPIRGRDR